MDIYKFAAQNRMLFPSDRGLITVEDLFDLPLTSKNGVDLDSVAKAVNAQLKAASEDSFVVTTVNPAKKKLEIALEIVKDVIATKQAEIEAALTARDRAARKQKILEAIEAKRDQQLTTASIEELTKQLEELGN